MEFVIFLLMVSFPLLIAWLDRQAKKRKGVPPVQVRPLFPAGTGSDAEASGDPSAPKSPTLREGERAVVHRKREIPAGKAESSAKPVGPEPKLRIDKRNLILYSEILKPKFDD